jgi:hypothetical protein
MAGDRIVLEGDNQKQADFLSRSSVEVDAKKIHDLHLITSDFALQDLRAFVLHNYSRTRSSKLRRSGAIHISG